MLSISQSSVFQKQMKFVPLVEMSEDKKYEYSLFNLDTSANVFSTTDITTDSIFLIMNNIPDDGLFPTSFTYKGNVFIKNCSLPVEQKQRYEQVLQWQQNNVNIIITDGFQYIDANEDSENISIFRIKEKISKSPGFFGSVNEFSDISPEIKNRIKKSIANIVVTANMNKERHKGKFEGFGEIKFGSKLYKWNNRHIFDYSLSEEKEKLDKYLSKLDSFIIDGAIIPELAPLPKDLDNQKIQNYINRQIEKIPELRDFYQQRRNVEQEILQQLKTFKEKVKNKYVEYIDMFTDEELREMQGSEEKFLELLNKKLNTGNLYDILQVAKTDSKPKIIKQSKNLLLKFHSDKHGHTGEAKTYADNIFKYIDEAYDILKSNDRKIYDTLQYQNMSLADVRKRITSEKERIFQKKKRDIQTRENIIISTDFEDIYDVESNLEKYKGKINELTDIVDNMEDGYLKTEFEDVIQDIIDETTTLDNNLIENLDTLGITDIKKILSYHIERFGKLRNSILQKQFTTDKGTYYYEIETRPHTFEELLDKFSTLSKEYYELQKQETPAEIDEQNIEMVRQTDDNDSPVYAAKREIEMQLDDAAESQDETVLQYLSYKLQELIDWLINFINNLMTSAKLD